MRKKVISVGVFLLILFGSLSFPQPGDTSANTPPPVEKAPTPVPIETTRTDAIDNGQIETKITAFPNGDRYWIKRLHFTDRTSQSYIFQLKIPGAGGTFTYIQNIDGTKKVKRVSLKNGSLPKYAGIISTDSYHMMLSYPASYIPGQRQTIEEYKSSPVSIAKTNDGYILTLRFSRQPDAVGEIWALESKNQLIDLNKAQLAAQWTRVNIGNDRKWSWDGMYEKTPPSYTPSGEDVYWRSPINYAANAFVMEDGSRAADDLGWLMLKTTLATQNADGYWQTGPRSDWLWKDYQIDSSFYDTRFNTDHALALLQGYRAYDDAEFLTASQRYADWLIRHADNEHVTVKGEKREGWLVPDYSHPSAHKRTHTSLNHQLAEMNYLLEMYVQTKNETYRTYAEKLLYGIKNTKSFWIKPDGDLHYAYEDGKGVKADYPLLTYNDLWEAQRLLKAVNGNTDADLADLMASKKKWMDKNKVTGYKTGTWQ